MKINRLPAMRGLVWIQQGFNLFKHNPLIWLALSLFNFACFALLEQLGNLGALAAMLLSPLLLGGWLLGCHDLAEDKPLKLAHAWAGFQHHANRLISLGGFALLLMLLVSKLLVSLGGETLATVMQSWKPTDDPEVLVKLLGADGVNLMLELFLVVSIPLIFLGMTMQFAPMLILFNKQTVFSALKLSLVGFVSNISPLTLYSLIWAMAYFTVLQLPEMLYAVVVVIGSPIVIASAYAAYHNVFPVEAIPAETVVV